MKAHGWFKKELIKIKRTPYWWWAEIEFWISNIVATYRYRKKFKQAVRGVFKDMTDMSEEEFKAEIDKYRRGS